MPGPYYVDMAVGNDVNAGTSEGAGNAWQTIDKAMNEVAAGETVWVKASANYTETAGIDTAGSAGSPIIFEGYTTATGDGGRATIDGGSARASGIIEGGSITNAYYVFRNFRITDHTGDGVDSSGMFQITWINCRFDNNSTGIDVGSNTLFIDCEFDTNSVDGAEASSDSKYVGCLAHTNTDDGIQLGAGGGASHCVAYGNGSSATLEGQIAITGGRVLVDHCTFDGDNSATKLGISSQQPGPTIINCIFYDCHVGIYSSGANYVVSGYSDYNSFASCTTDVTNLTAGSNSITDAGDPFTNSAGRDYTLASTAEGESDAGRDYNDATSGADMGAHQLSQAGGGGLTSFIDGGFVKS